MKFNFNECERGYNNYNFYDRKEGCIELDFLIRNNERVFKVFGGFIGWVYEICFGRCKRGALTTTTPGVDLTIQHPRQIPIGNRNFPPYINKFLTTFELK